jgi:hypothetical protein
MCKFCLLAGVLLVGIVAAQTATVEPAVLKSDSEELKEVTRALDVAKLAQESARTAHESALASLKDARAALSPFIRSAADPEALRELVTKFRVVQYRAVRLGKLSAYHKERAEEAKTQAQAWGLTANAAEAKVNALLPETAKPAWEELKKAISAAAGARFDLFKAQTDQANIEARIRRIVKRMVDTSAEREALIKELNNSK